MLQRIIREVDHRTASGIARAIGRLVRQGTISPGDKLPTVRSLAAALGVSPSTVSETWRILQGHGVIQTDRRRGTVVRSSSGSLDGRAWHVPVEPGTLDLDLSTGTPDPHLLPSMGQALSRVHLDLPVTSYLDRPVVPELEQELRERWPFSPEALTIVDGAQDALDRIVAAVVHVGDTVLVEDPTFPPLLDMLELAGARIVGIPLDAEGVQVERVAEALELDPVAIFLQPRAHNPTGCDMTEARGRALADLFADQLLLIVEDDHSAEISGAPLVSLGTRLPRRVLHIRSFSKSHGPDLRLAAIGGCADPLDAIIRRRRLGPSWSSRLLQQVLLDLLRDPLAEKAVARAQQTYTTRRDRLRRHLEELGIPTRRGSGLNLWIPVSDDQRAVVALAAHGIGVAPGKPFEVADPRGDHIRVTTARLDQTQIARVAQRIAEASSQSFRHSHH